MHWSIYKKTMKINTNDCSSNSYLDLPITQSQSSNHKNNNPEIRFKISQVKYSLMLNIRSKLSMISQDISMINYLKGIKLKQSKMIVSVKIIIMIAESKLHPIRKIFK
jgi:hypothetical protein